jgi:SAM-dependent methyltransferase
MGQLADAYEGVEDLSSFSGVAALEAYRRTVLERSVPQAGFLLERVEAPARVLEVACGNGRLLIELARRGALAAGRGLDIAASRIAFAERWAADEGMPQIRFEAGDVFQSSLEAEAYDATVCITGAFGYFEPLAPGSALELTRRLNAATRPGGLLALELYPAPHYRRMAEAGGGEARVWKELPADDPWRYYLSHVVLEREGQVLTHNKTFIHRETGEVDSGRSERLFVYTPESIGELLAEAGFEEASAFAGWTDAPYAGGDSMVVMARRPG